MLLFYKPPGDDFEVYNDLNSLLVNLFRCVQSSSKARRMKELLKYSLNSREEFNRIRKVMLQAEKINCVRRAAYYYQLIRYSYSASTSSFGGRSHDIRGDFPLIDEATVRLKDVIIENKDFEDIIMARDSDDTFFYCDPPYHNSEQVYKNVAAFSESDHYRLRNLLNNISGKFLLSYNDDGFIRDLYDDPKFCVLDLKRSHNMKQRYKAGSEYPELLIANYDLYDPSELYSAQTTFFTRKEFENEI